MESRRISRVGSFRSDPDDGGVAVRFVTKLNALKLAAEVGADSKSCTAAAAMLAFRRNVGRMVTIDKLDQKTFGLT
jgi:hypothetical protein